MSDDKDSKLSCTRREETSAEQSQLEGFHEAREYLDLAEVMLVALNSDGVVVFVNRKCCEVLGYDHDEIIGKDWFKTFLPKRVRKETYNALRSLMKGKIEPVEYFENPVLTKDGEERIIAWHNTVMKNSKGQIDGVLSSGEDITERKRAEKALHQSEEQLNQIFNTTADGMRVVDKDFKIIRMNDTLASMTGVSIEDAMELKCHEAFGGAFCHTENCTLIRILGGEERITMDIDKETPAGVKIPCILSATPFKDSRGAVIGIVEAFRDITDRKRAEEALRESEEKYRTILENITPRKKAEEALRASQQLLKRTFDSLNEAVIVLDAETVEIVDCNPATETIFGYSRHELMGKKVNMLHVDEATLEEFRENLYPAIEKEGVLGRFEFRMKRRDGIAFPTEHSVTPLMNEQGTRVGWVSVVRDISERKKTEDALRESEKRFKTFFEQAAVGVSIVEMDDNIIEANPFFQELIGYSADELVTMKVADFTHPDDTAIDASLTREVLDGKRDYFTMEKRYIRKTGEEIWGKLSANFVKDEEGIPEFCIGIIENITERKKAEEKLRESEERYRVLIETMNDGVGVVDENKRFTFVNIRFAEMLGRSPEEMTGQLMTDFVHSENLNILTENIEKRREGLASTYELTWITKTGGEVVSIVSGSPLHDRDGNHRGSFAVITDITGRKRAEEALRESESNFRSLAENTPDYIMRYDKECRHLYENPAALRVSGLTEENIIGKTHREAGFDEELCDFWEEKITAVFKTSQSSQTIFEWEGAEGKAFLDWRLVPEFDESGQVKTVLGISRDITEQKNLEETLRESEQRNRMIVDAMSDLVLVYDSEGRYSDYFARDDSLLVRPWNEIRGRTQEEILPLDIAAQHNAHAKKVRETGESVTFEYELEIDNALRLFEGTMILHEDNESIVVAVKDITERKLVEENLRQSEEKYRSLFDNTPVGLTFQEIVVDESGRPIDFVFIDVNEGFEALMGLRKEDIVGKSASHVLTSSGETELDWIDVYGKVALTSARARFDQYSEALGRWFSVTAYSPEKNSFITAYTDITEQKRAYEDLKQQKKELSDFAHTMSHDLNTYFFKFRGLVHLLESKDEIPEIRRIQLLIAEMSNLVQHSVVLADAGLVIDKKHKLDLAHLVRDVAVRHLPEGIALVQGPLLSVMADEIKLIQIFQNLFENAVEHGTPKTVEVQRYDSMDGVRIVVANDGKQISNDSRPKVFQSGFTTKGKRRGFGLSIVKKLVEAHGWQIKLVDTPETAFEILIPSAAG